MGQRRMSNITRRRRNKSGSRSPGKSNGSSPGGRAGGRSGEGKLPAETSLFSNSIAHNTSQFQQETSIIGNESAGKKWRRRKPESRKRNYSQEETAEDSKITHTEQSKIEHMRSRTVMDSTMLASNHSTQDQQITQQ